MATSSKTTGEVVATSVSDENEVESFQADLEGNSNAARKEKVVKLAGPEPKLSRMNTEELATAYQGDNHSRLYVYTLYIYLHTATRYLLSIMYYPTKAGWPRASTTGIRTRPPKCQSVA